MLKVLIIALLILPNIVSANITKAISYKITPNFTNLATPFLIIEAEFSGDFKGDVAIDLPCHWAGRDYYKQIKNIKLINPIDNTKLSVKLDKINCDYLASIKTIGADKIVLSYEVHQEADNISDVHNAIIRSNLIHSPGVGIFAVPTKLCNKDIQVPISISWLNLPDDWRILTSFGNSLNVQFSSNIDNLMGALYTAGDLNITQIAQDDSKTVYLSLNGNFGLSNELMIDDLRDIVHTQGSFFNDNKLPHYIISLIEGDESNSWGGTNLKNCFTAFIPKDMSSKDFYILMAHEYLHNWINNGELRDANEERFYYWWSEGFTDYYSRVLAMRSKGISVEDFVQSCNDLLREYYLSPVINEPNSRIAKDFWRNYSIEKLPYYRGFTFAIYLNYLIKNNNPNYSLDDVIKDLVETIKIKKIPFTKELFIAITNKYLPIGVEPEIRKFIEQGQTINLNELIKVLPLKKMQVGNYHAGFNSKIFRETKIIKEIDINSNAYKAGLRNGDKVIEFDMWSNPLYTATIKTIDKVVKFKPEHYKIKHNIYQLKESLSDKEKAEIMKFF